MRTHTHTHTHTHLHIHRHKIQDNLINPLQKLHKALSLCFSLSLSPSLSYTHTRTHARTHAHTHTHTCMHAGTYACTNTCMQTHTHSRSLSLITHTLKYITKHLCAQQLIIIRFFCFCSKLFAKKLEKLFSSDYASPDSPENASTLYRWVTLLFTKSPIIPTIFYLKSLFRLAYYGYCTILNM